MQSFHKGVFEQLHLCGLDDGAFTRQFKCFLFDEYDQKWLPEKLNLKHEEVNQCKNVWIAHMYNLPDLAYQFGERYIHLYIARLRCQYYDENKKERHWQNNSKTFFRWRSETTSGPENWRILLLGNSSTVQPGIHLMWPIGFSGISHKYLWWSSRLDIWICIHKNHQIKW